MPGIVDVLKRLLWMVAAVFLGLALWQLEMERATVLERELATDAGPVTIYGAPVASEGPLVIVAHGFSGSRQMMQYLSRDLARAGFTVAAFDFLGHGRSEGLLSPDVTRIEGTTRQLVDQTLAIIAAVRRETGSDGPMALLGHSMATDIIIRAAQDLPDVRAIVAISMYSEAITPQFPERLLMIAGAWEGRLRAAGLRALEQLTDAPEEGVTVERGSVMRRAIAVPGTEHVAVLFSSVTAEESRAWLKAAFPSASAGTTLPRGVQVAGVLLALVILVWPASRVLPVAAFTYEPLPSKQFFSALLLPVLPALAAALLTDGTVAGVSGFAALLAFFGVWGIVSLLVMHRTGRTMSRPRPEGAVFLAAWALGLFALALDRYGAAFLPTGPRLPLLVFLLAGTVPFACADRLLVWGAPVWQRLLARVLPIGVLTAAMVIAPKTLGLMFTAVPVLLLFFAVYGSMARAVALRSGPGSAGIAQGVILAWALAASLPLFLPAAP